MSVDGQLMIGVDTECAPLSGLATITGNTLTAKDIATGASGCTDANAGEQHLWVMDFLKRPIEMTFSQGTLIWKGGANSLSFQPD
ncbi:hypothetical protein M8J71_10065 [Pseudarthrobacter sp. R1]|uniref:hypothetical protein n=1 Tax=Pseudarthrobacter sp. R1 TaxID=2944934 RepID=UPI00210A5551|nr:hypothetical protein [Pseudarthrobacter sp. R1]MCQ6270825.1 hypothetical protein [Pseudarthrobacter sp. R1]